LWDLVGAELTAFYEGAAKHFHLEKDFERAGKCQHCYERFHEKLKAAVHREEEERRNRIN
jgi:hypothetical protein